MICRKDVIFLIQNQILLIEFSINKKTPELHN